MNLAKQGFFVLRSAIHWQSNSWRIMYYTLKGGWSRLDSYCQVSYPTQQAAEDDINRLIKQDSTKFIKDL